MICAAIVLNLFACYEMIDLFTVEGSSFNDKEGILIKLCVSFGLLFPLGVSAVVDCSQGNTLDITQCLSKKLSDIDKKLHGKCNISQGNIKTFNAHRSSICNMISQPYKGGSYGAIVGLRCESSLSQWFMNQHKAYGANTVAD